MNKVFKTVWNAVRGQLVVVNETTKSHAQSNVSTKSGSKVSLLEPVQVFKKSAIALMLTGVMSAPCVYAADWNIDNAVDTAGSKDLVWDNATVTETGKLTHNEAPDFFLTINGTLTNQGTIEGTGHIKAQNVDNQSTLTTGKLEFKAPSSGLSTFTNSGTFVAKDANLSSVSLSNTGDLSVGVMRTSGGKITNSGTLTLDGFINTEGGKIVNETTGVLNFNDGRRGTYINSDFENKGMINATRIDLYGDAVMTDMGKMHIKTALYLNENAVVNFQSKDVAQIGALNISKGGAVNVAKGTVVKGGNLIGPTSGNSLNALVDNQGHLDFNYFKLMGHSYRGSGIFGNETSWFENWADDVDIGTVHTGWFTNNSDAKMKVANLNLYYIAGSGYTHRNWGELTIKDSLSGGQLINYGTIDLDNATVAKGANIYNGRTTSLVKGKNATLMGQVSLCDGASMDAETLTIVGGELSLYSQPGKVDIDSLALRKQGEFRISSEGALATVNLLDSDSSNLKIYSQGALEVTGSLNLANKTTLTIEDQSSVKAKSLSSDLTSEIRISDKSQLIVDDLNSVENAHFVLNTGGNISGNGWFNKSIVDINDGEYDFRGHSLGKGNEYNVGYATLEEDTSLLVNKITSENTFNISDVLDVKEIAFEEGVAEGATVYLDGGTIRTSLDQVFNNVVVDRVEGLDWDAQLPDTIVVIEKPGLGVTQVGQVKDLVKKRVVANTRGEFVFTDSVVTLDTVEDVSRKVLEAYRRPGGGESITASFLGKLNQLLTVDVVNSLRVKDPDSKIIFNNNALFVTDGSSNTPKKTLYVGGVAQDDGVLLASGYGFNRLTGSNNVVIQDSGELALIGDRFHYVSGDDRLSATVDGTKSKLVLGSVGHIGDQGGSFETLTLKNGGNLHVRAGNTSVNQLVTEGSGNVVVDRGAQLTPIIGKVDSLQIENQGEIHSIPYGEHVNGVKVKNTGYFSFYCTGQKKCVLKNTSIENENGEVSLDVFIYEPNLRIYLTENTVLDNKSIDPEFETMTLGRFVATDNSQIINKGNFLIKQYGVLENGKSNAYADKWYAFDNQQGGATTIKQGLTVGAMDGNPSIETVLHNAGLMLFVDDKAWEGDTEKEYQATLKVAQNGIVINEKGAHLETKILDMSRNGFVENKGSIVTKSMTMKDDATLQISGGEIVVTDGLDFLGGTIHFLGQPTIEKNGIVATGGSLMLKEPINGTLAIDNASVTVGAWVPPAEQPEATTLKAPFTGSTLIADVAPLQIGEKGKLAVGAGAKAHAETMTAGSAWFGGDSNFVIDTSKLTQVAVDAEADETTVAALVGSGKLDVAKGAKLYVNKLGLGKYYVTKDFAEELLADGSWADNIVYGEGVNKGMELTQDKDGNVILTVVKKPDPKPPVVDPEPPVVDPEPPVVDPKPPVNPDKPVEPEMIKPMTAIDNIFTEVITSPDLRDPNRNDVVGLVNQAINSAPDDALVSVIDKVSQIGADGGLMTQNFTLASNVIDQVDRHLSYEDVHFNHGVLQTWEGARLWANALGQKVEVSGAEYEGSDTSYDGENYGFIMGADLITNNGWRYGAAFGYQKGNMDSMDAVVTTSNKADAFSVTGYAAKQFGQLNVIGSLGYSYIDADLEQNLPFDMKFKKHTLHSKSDVITAGLKGEMHFKLNDNVAVVPYVGLRAVTVLADKQTSKLDGHDAFTYDNDTLLQIQTPMGVSVQGLNTSASGWNGRGVFDISMTPVFGDKAMDTTVTGTGSSKTDYVSSVFADKCTGSVRMGYSFEKGALSVGGNLGVTLGDMQKSAVTFGLNGRYAF